MADFKVKNQGHRIRLMPQTPEATALVKKYAMKVPPQLALIERGLLAGWYFLITGPNSEIIISQWIENAGMEVPAEAIGAGDKNQNTFPPPSWLRDDNLHETHLNELLDLQ